MKKGIILICCICCLCSCHTALHVPLVQRTAVKKSKPNMEFIGCKNISRNAFLLKELGTELEKGSIALNTSHSFVGYYYTLAELENYNSQMRYITYIDVIKQNYTWRDDIKDDVGLYTAGWIVAGATVFTLFPVYVPLFCAANKDFCEIQLLCEYNIIVYDTETKKIVFSKLLTIDKKDVYKGQYSHRKTDSDDIRNQYNNIIYNTTIDGYSEAWDYVNTLPK